MGIIVKDLSQDKLVLYLKGADTVIEEKISHLNCDFMLESCSDLAREGLRTLVITEKVLSEECNIIINLDYEGWKK